MSRISDVVNKIMQTSGEMNNFEFEFVRFVQIVKTVFGPYMVRKLHPKKL